MPTKTKERKYKIDDLTQRVVRFHPPMPFKSFENGEWALMHHAYIEPVLLRDFKYLKGWWVPTQEVGTHGAFDCWFPCDGPGTGYVRATREECQKACGPFEKPIQIKENYPLVAILPFTFMEHVE